MSEAYEEIKLSDDKQAQIDNRKKELEAMLANMQMLESEVDELDAEFDDQLSALLKPDLAIAGLDELLIKSKPKASQSKIDNDDEEEQKD